MTDFFVFREKQKKFHCVVVLYGRDLVILLAARENKRMLAVDGDVGIREEILRLKEEGSTIILSTHNMESVEELCDSIALINKSHVVITGGVEEIRRKYGNNNVELIYTSEAALKAVPGVFDVLSDQDDMGRHTSVLSIESVSTTNDVLAEVMKQGLTVNSFKELVPRMNDIFIKLVTEEE